MRKGWGDSRWRKVARFRLGCKIRGSRYWQEEEKRNYRLCGKGIETRVGGMKRVKECRRQLAGCSGIGIGGGGQGRDVDEGARGGEKRNGRG